MPVQLLPFHQFGQNKYEKLGLEYEMAEYKSLHPEDLNGFMQALNKHGIPCSI